MKLKNSVDVEKFLEVVNSCNDNVYLTSQYGDRYNLRSKLTQFVAINALLGENGDELELWCDDRNDEAKFVQFFFENPEIL